jgi:DNA-binding HxlR family transcriptional regulator
MTTEKNCREEISIKACNQRIAAVKDTLYVIGGKWKMPIIVALNHGPLRFKQLLRELEDITPKILSKELKQLELNEFISRTVYPTSPVTVEYQLTEYSESFNGIIKEMSDWGMKHKKTIIEKSRSRRLQLEGAA